MPIHLTCPVCSRAFTRNPARIRPTGNYCSNRCNSLRQFGPPPPLALSEDGLTAFVPLRARDGDIKAYAAIDAADAEWVNQRRWGLSDQGYAYRGVCIDGKRTHLKLHREILGLTRGDGMDGDHIDRDRLNCRRGNLRIVPRGKNQQNLNSRVGATSTHRGVCWDATRGKWLAQVKVDGRQKHIGRFDSEAEAAAAVQSVRLAHMPYAVD